MHIYILPQCSTTAASVLNSAGMDAQFARSCCAISRGILNTKKFRFHSDTPFHLHIVLLFSVGELSGRIPICPSGYAITVTHDGYSVVCKELNAICYSYYTKHIP